MTSLHPIIELEMAALDAWCQGDPSGFLDLAAEDVTYFDPFEPTRLDGLAMLRPYYEGLRGQIQAPHREMVDPQVLEVGEVAILTFRFVSRADSEAAEMRWNCTEVYCRDGEVWRIAHTHWSFTGGAS